MLMVVPRLVASPTEPGPLVLIVGGMPEFDVAITVKLDA